MEKQKILNNQDKKRKRKILLGVLIPVAIIGIALATALPLTLCHKKSTDKIMKWVDAKEYFEVNDDDGEIVGFRGGNRSGIEFDFLKVCAEKKYSGIEFASEISSIGNNAFAFCAGFGHGSPIKTISMNSVTTIDINAFFGCESLTSINLGSSVISIGESAFDSCSSLTSISSSGDVTVSSIGTSAFQGCTKFTGIDGGKLIVTHIPGQSSIGSGAFHGCANLSLDFIKNMKVDAAYQSDDTTKLKHGTDKSLGYDYICPVSSFTLGTNSMYESGAGCLLAGSIPSYDLPTTIGDYAFNYCSSLTSISSSGDVTVSSIGISAFEGCTKFTGIDGGKLIVTHITGQSSIGAGAFHGCANLSLDFIKNMNVDAACLDDDTTKLIHGTDKSLGYDYISPESSFTLGTTPMYNSGSGCLLAGSIPSSDLPTTIGNNAFNYCSSLTSINLGSSVTTIGDYAFNYCSSLTSISSSGDVTVSSIGISAFEGCTKFTGIDGGKLIVTHITGQSSIGAGAFGGCANLSLDFIKNMNVDAACLDDDTTKLIHGTDKSLGYDYICPASSFTLGTNSMYNYGSGCLLAGSIPSSALSSSIIDFAFFQCASLNSIDCSSSTSIGLVVFSGCATLNNFLF